MAFPDTPLPVQIDMYVASLLGWVDITDHVRVADGIKIRRGYPDEKSSPPPSSCTMTLDNRDGDFSPRNPLGAYYGLIGRNTPIRVTVRMLADDFDRTATDSWGSSTDPTGAGVVGSGFSWAVASTGTGTDADFDVTAGAATMVVAAEDETRQARLTGGPAFRDGELRVTVNTDQDGTATGGYIYAAVLVRAADTSTHYRAEVGISGDVVDLTLYGPDGLIAAEPTTGVTYSGQPLRLAFAAHGPALAAKVWDAAGTEPADWTVSGTDHGLREAGPIGLYSAVADENADAPVTFTFSDLTVVSRRYLGEVSEWPARWDVSGNDAWVPVTAQGVLRRLGQGNRPARSPLKSAALAAQVEGEAVLDTAPLDAYWPMEDVAGTRFSSALAGGAALTRTGEAPDLASVSPFEGSSPVATLGPTTVLTGAVPAPTTTSNGFTVMMVLDVPTSPGWVDGTPILRVQQAMANTTVAAWEVRYTDTPGLAVYALDPGGTVLSSSSTFGPIFSHGKAFLLAFAAVADSWSLFTRSIDDNTGEVEQAGPVDQTFGLEATTPIKVTIAPSGGLDMAGIGHLLVAHHYDFGDFFAETGAVSPLSGYVGERAATRAARLCTEAGVGFTGVFADSAAETPRMGPQDVEATFADALTETWVAALALVSESRHELGLTWRSLRSLTNRPAMAALDYTAAGEVGWPLEPTDDDQHLRNDVEVRRKVGGAARYVDAASVAAVGRYETSIEVNLDVSEDPLHHASWRVHVGIWDESRYRAVRMDLAAMAQHDRSALVVAAADLDVGDGMTVANLPVWGAPGDADLMTIGFAETIAPHKWEILT